MIVERCCLSQFSDRLSPKLRSNYRLTHDEPFYGEKIFSKPK